MRPPRSGESSRDDHELTTQRTAFPATAGPRHRHWIWLDLVLPLLAVVAVVALVSAL